MILSGLQIINFRNFKSANFLFYEGANTIIGENDSGKSNAMTALRILLDDSYYYNTKRLKESDFSNSIPVSWKGNWIIISATFSHIDDVEKDSEICCSIAIDDKENAASINSLIKSSEDDCGVVTLFIRPQKDIRAKLFKASGKQDEFDSIRNSISVSDYEFYFTSKAPTDFADETVYCNIVGDLNAYIASNPEDDDTSVLGCKINISDLQDHLSLVYIDALRDVARDLNNPRNPVRKIIEVIESKIDPKDIEEIKKNIATLNNSISSVKEISEIGIALNKKLIDIIGMVYSPSLHLSSELSNELKSLSKYVTMKPGSEEDIELLGLGHLNMIYIALKIIEYETCRTRELINIMILEEPEAHIHAHIQKTLFDNLSISKKYTQIIMTTHSTHLAESSQISKMNILKCLNGVSISMNPSNNLDEFGKDYLKKSGLNLSECIERYLDAKRSVLLFSKGVILVEGDGEEILIPNLIKKAFGVSLDEIGVGLINIGSTAFEYIACLFGEDRIRRHCAIITDLDEQVVSDKSPFYKEDAEKQGVERKNKLDNLFKDNVWVTPFFAKNTLEIEFVNSGNSEYIIKTLDKIYSKTKTIEEHTVKLNSPSDMFEEVLNLAKNQGKGWFATLISNELDCLVNIPFYILEAVAFASQETINIKILEKMVMYTLEFYHEDEYAKKLLKVFNSVHNEDKTKKLILAFLSRPTFQDDIVKRFIEIFNKNVGWFEIKE